MRTPSGDLDVITVEVVKNALHVAALEMQATVLRTAHSQIIRETADVSSSIFDPQGRIVAQALALPLQLAGSSVAIKEVFKVFPDRLDAARRCLCSQRPLPWGIPSAGYHLDDAVFH